MENPYNVVAYQSSPFPQAHINRLATMATLFGIDPPDVHSCRVLELGCGEGVHLIPMAMEYPDSQFVGIDVADRPIARATQLASDLEVPNARFRVADLRQLGGQPGECDYLIAHGLYSWVAPDVQNRILDLCGRLLATNGIAYISYNAYPAWHVREMTRNMVRIHTAGLEDPVEIRNRAITLLAAIYRSQGGNEPYRDTIRQEMDRLIAKDPALCFHDDFGPHNAPVYFTEFVRRAASHGLQFLCEADSTDLTRSSDLAAETREALESIADPIEREQYYDFLTARGFRRTLLCKTAAPVDRAIPPERLRKLFFASPVKAPKMKPEELISDEPLEFATEGGGSITVNQPFVKAVLWQVAQVWPAALGFDELRARAEALADPPDGAEAESMLREVVLRMQLPGVIDISIAPWSHAQEVSATPTASRLARYQAKIGNRVTSLRHRPVDLDEPLLRLLLPLLDGSREVKGLTGLLAVEESEVDRALLRLHELALLAR
jgi:methyltransferase-like protein/16S rRNA G527 N7-methylase RsmG